MRFLLLLSLLFSTLLTARVIHVQAVENGDTVLVADAFNETGFDDEFEKEFAEPAGDELFDPLSGYNRIMTGFNDTFYVKLLFPVARGYSTVVPEGARQGVSRFFNNLRFPIRFVNNLLQLKFAYAAEELARFGINSTIGILGFYDPAKEEFGLQTRDEDFGQTLGFYGTGGGFHIVLPILGPSNLRDSVGLAADWYADPTGYWENRRYNLMENYVQALAVKSFDTVNEASFDGEAYESLKKDAIELYPFLRDVYRQNREKQIEE